MPDPTLPPVGSLWLHRETGERRFVVVSVFSVQFALAGRSETVFTSLADWLAWQAGAERIDKEKT